MVRNPIIGKLADAMGRSTADGKPAGLDLIESTMLERDPTLTRYSGELTQPCIEQAYVGTAAKRFSDHGRHLFMADEGLCALLAETDLGEARGDDLALPFTGMFVAFPTTRSPGAMPGRANVIDGAYVSSEGEFLEVTVVGRLLTLDRRPWPHDEDPLIILRLAKGRPLDEALDAAIAYATVRTTETYRSAQRDLGIDDTNAPEPIPMTDDAHGALRRAATLALNVACYLTATPDDVEAPVHPADAPEHLASKALTPGRPGLKARQALVAIGHLRVVVVGRRVARRAFEAMHGDGTSPSPHWRRGHWRRQRHGQALAMVRLRWIMPVVVNARLGAPEADGRAYLVTSE